MDSTLDVDLPQLPDVPSDAEKDVADALTSAIELAQRKVDPSERHEQVDRAEGEDGTGHDELEIVRPEPAEPSGHSGSTNEGPASGGP
ncbi:MAG: hypothetical protein H0W83_17265 [Planctomycetes bacterium]|nr:hypothetical protein [Planctomycetota bacterium]